MDGWMGGWMGGRIDGWMDGWMDGWTDGGMDGWMDGWMGGWRDGPTDGLTEGGGRVLRGSMRVEHRFLKIRLGRCMGCESPKLIERLLISPSASGSVESPGC